MKYNKCYGRIRRVDMVHNLKKKKSRNKRASLRELLMHPVYM